MSKTPQPQKESKEDAIRRVAREIQDILVANHMTMVPSISIGLNEDRVESSIIDPTKTPGGKAILTHEDIEREKQNNPLFAADFMQD